MFQIFIIKTIESPPCQKRHINRDKELPILLITILKWKMLNHQKDPILCPSDQAASTSLTLTGTPLHCKNNTLTQCTEATNSTPVFPASITNIHPRVWDFHHRRWTQREKCLKFITKAPFLSFNKVQIQKVIFIQQSRKWIPEGLIKVEFRMKSN